jgi:hypothetical protein
LEITNVVHFAVPVAGGLVLLYTSHRPEDQHLIVKVTIYSDGWLNISGGWFNGQKNAIMMTEADVRDFAPKYVLQHRDKYKELLVHPDKLKVKVNSRP